ncbi:MAG: alpha/beta hydrolase [Acidobacteriota bacterium]
MTLYFEEEGSGEETIVFLHGLGVSGWMWTEQVEALRSEWHCLNVHLPGNGESHEIPWLSLADSADAVAEVIRSHGKGSRAHVVGLSLGGYVGLHLLARHPDVVRKMVISGVTTRPLQPRFVWWPLTRLVAFFSGFGFVAKLSARSMQLPPETVPLYLHDARRLSSRTIRRVYDEVLEIELPEQLAENERPLLAVAGQAEAKSVLASLEDLRSIVNTSCRIAPDVHHAWNAERPDLFTQMIRSWVSGDELPEELVVPA